MRIMPVVNEQPTQKPPSPAFGATIKEGTLKDLAQQLSLILPKQQTDIFLTEVAKREKQISSIKFNKTQEVEIYSPGLKGEGENINITVYSDLMKSHGSGSAHAMLYSKFFKEGNSMVSGKTLAKRFIQAIKEATNDISNSLTHLSYKSEQIEKSINMPEAPQPAAVLMGFRLPEHRTKVPMPKVPEPKKD